MMFKFTVNIVIEQHYCNGRTQNASENVKKEDVVYMIKEQKLHKMDMESEYKYKRSA